MMKCPFCQAEMSEGVLHAGSRYIQWKTVEKETGRKQEYLLAKSYMGGVKMEGHLCPYCRKLVLDLPDMEG
ncbi:MAG: hypothetical protein IKI88_06820 [Anaerotignum sp.]|nr:hypothetical protein [Anaerotignum sp.]